MSGGDGEALARRRATRGELGAGEDPATDRVLATLVERRLLVAGDDTVELVHEALLDQWPRLRAWLDEDAHGRRLHTHLAQAAAAWDSGGRDESELYRGPRLAATLEWAATSGGDVELNRLEREFLEESRTAFAREGDRQRRANRRLRTLLALTLALLLAAIGAGVIAARQWGTARSQETAAVAQRLGAQALAEPRLDRSLCSRARAPTSTTHWPPGATCWRRWRGARRRWRSVRPGGERLLDDALSHDGRTLAVRANDGSVAFFDTRTLREVGEHFTGSGQISYYGAIVRPVRALAFSPDDRTLAVGESTGWSGQLFLLDRRTHEVQATTVTSGTAVTADVAFAPDGRTLVTGEAVSGEFSPPDLVLVRRRAVDGVELGRSQPIPGGRLVGFTRDGRSLLVTSGETSSLLLDTRTFRTIRSYPVAGSPTLSPAADIAAFGRGDGSVVLVDLRTGARRATESSAAGGVTAAAFSSDGTAVASTSVDGSVDIWDVASASRRRTFEGHAGAAHGPSFSPDGATLYSGSNDGSVILWDASGERTLGRRFRFDPVAADGDGPHPPVEGATWAVAVTSDGSLFATSPGPGRVTLWRTSDHAVLGELRGPLSVIDSLVFSRDGRLLAATGDSPNTVVWNVATRKVAHVIGPAGDRGSSAVAVSPDGRVLATAGIDGVLRVYDVRSGRSLGTERISSSWQDLDFSSDGRRIAAVGLGGELTIWNVGTRAVERRGKALAGALHRQVLARRQDGCGGRSRRRRLPLGDGERQARRSHVRRPQRRRPERVVRRGGGAAGHGRRRREPAALGRRLGQARRAAVAWRGRRRVGRLLPGREAFHRDVR